MAESGGSVRELLERTRARLSIAGIHEHRLEAELLLQHALGIDAARMFAGLNDPVPLEAETALDRLAGRRADREPLAYITGRRGFYGREFAVTPDVLIPRPETELLVELALRWATANSDLETGLRIADIGTGSGAIAVTLASEINGSFVDAVDLSPQALEVARSNARRMCVTDRIEFFEGDLAGPLKGRRYQIVTANLPYVRPDTLARAEEEVRREPELALLGGKDGLDVIRRFALMLPDIMDSAGSLALFEVDPLTADGAAEAIAAALPAARVWIELDLARLERCVAAELH
ncbi:MAG: peptide chain release factor N(5)-glutamine methyltransferase [Chloroflexi bacterium]|nr:peptide chain release factor N(5)-glutamine methyltransferase [Chloroflexota bacterium]